MDPNIVRVSLRSIECSYLTTELRFNVWGSVGSAYVANYPFVVAFNSVLHSRYELSCNAKKMLFPWAVSLIA